MLRYVVAPLAAVVAAATMTGCAQTSSTVAGVAPSSTRLAVSTPGGPTRAQPAPSHPLALPHDLAGCPQPTPIASGGPVSAVDYVDFVDANGYTYLGGHDPKLADDDRGDLQLRVTCTVSTWSDRYMQGMANKDGNAAFLPTGTRVYAVNGKSPLCELMAKAEDGWHRYRASQNPACSGGQAPGATALPAAPSTAGLAACPTPRPAAKDGQGVAIDFADFVQFRGTAFVVDDRLTVAAADKGAPAFRVRCPLGLLNDATHLTPPAPRDGDSSYLAAGTQVFAISGFATRCRLMAQGPEGWQAYTPRPTPSGCPAVPEP